MWRMQREPPALHTATDPLASLLLTVGPRGILDEISNRCHATGLFVTNAESVVVYWNAMAERLCGLPANSSVGTSLAALAARIKCPALSENTMRHAQTDTVTLPIAVTAGDTIQRSLWLSMRRFSDANGRTLALLGLLTTAAPDGSLSPSILPAGQRSETTEFYGLVSRDPVMQQAFQIIRNVAETDSTVLVRGESGTGKEIVARAVHTLSERREGPFLAVNCASLTPSLLESELFGHVRGAFTGALKDHAGLFKRADGGTVFLDEIAELPMDLQAKLLRVIQERSFLPVGGDRPVHVDVRIVSATHRALREEVKAGRFRDDLMYRLRVVPIFLPPLRERRGDVSLLLRHFIDKHNATGHRHVVSVAPEAMRKLLDHDWPGNVRELQNVVEYAFAVGRGPELLLDELPPEFNETAGKSPQKMAPTEKKADEQSRILNALTASDGNLDEAARRLGINRTTLWRKRRKYNI